MKTYSEATWLRKWQIKYIALSRAGAWLHPEWSQSGSWKSVSSHLMLYLNIYLKWPLDRIRMRDGCWMLIPGWNRSTYKHIMAPTHTHTHTPPVTLLAGRCQRPNSSSTVSGEGFSHYVWTQTQMTLHEISFMEFHLLSLAFFPRTCSRLWWKMLGGPLGTEYLGNLLWQSMQPNYITPLSNQNVCSYAGFFNQLKWVFDPLVLFFLCCLCAKSIMMNALKSFFFRSW